MPCSLKEMGDEVQHLGGYGPQGSRPQGIVVPPGPIGPIGLPITSIARMRAKSGDGWGAFYVLVNNGWPCNKARRFVEALVKKYAMRQWRKEYGPEPR